MPVVGNLIARRRLLVLFWNATNPVTLNAGDEISCKVLALRRTAEQDLEASECSPTHLHSSTKIFIQDAASSQSSMEGRHSDSSKDVSSLVALAAAAETPLGMADSPCASISFSGQREHGRLTDEPSYW